jgi:pimeloyl-ACP methyl ester carboxylesterase
MGMEEQPVVLAAHSGGGVLLPAIAKKLPHPVKRYLFVDALLPEKGKSRLELFDTPDEAEAFRQAAINGLLPPWTEEDLNGVIADSSRRRMVARELKPLPLAVYEERVPCFQGWPDAPCGYLHFSSAYDSQAAKAR